MALTVVKYRKNSTGETTGAAPAILLKNKVINQQPMFVKKPVIKLEGGGGLVINKIPATIRPTTTWKRTSSSPVEPVAIKSAKYSLQAVASAGTPQTSFQWQSGTTISPKRPQQNLGAAISSLPPNTIIQSTPGRSISRSDSNSGGTLLSAEGARFSIVGTPVRTVASNVTTPRKVIIQREIAKRSIRSVTMELIEKNPQVHLGVNANRLPLLKNIICTTADVSVVDCYLTLKKLRQNEEFALLAEYFEMSDVDAQQVFVRSVVRLARYLRFLVTWPDSKKYYDRHKNMPFGFRSNLSHVQSLIECVETDMQKPMQIDCSNYKFILSISTNGIISYISEAFVGQHDDLTIFNASNFKSIIPKHLSLVADPGKGIRRRQKTKSDNPNQQPSNNAETDSTTDSADESAGESSTDDNDDGRQLSRYAAARVAGELASHQTLNVVDSKLKSRKVKDFSIPTVRVREPVCRLLIRHMIYCLREFKILQPHAIQEALLYQYLNEILTVTAALTNLQR